MREMNDSSDHKLRVFTEALGLPAHERAAYLERACARNVELRRAVEALLQEYNQVGDFLEKSPNAPSNKANAETAGAEKPGDYIGGYKLLQQIGEGGCGVVFMAEQTQPVHRKVALKVIKPGMDTRSVIARFEAERQVLALMDHPNIAKIFDAGATQSGRPYFVMELVRGMKITGYCDQHSMTTEDRLKLFIPVCQAVQHAHQKGIIHRDIKPSNILVTTTEAGTPLPVVIDFGIAKATTNQRLTDKTLFTAFEMLIGTPAYMSPEQAAFTGVDVDTRTDVYSLGVLLYELLTGSTPFDTEALLKSGLDEIRRVIREEDPARPSARLSRMKGESLTVVAQYRGSEPPRLIRTIRGDLDWIAMKALEKDRTRRYETANDLALDVKRLLENEPVSARPPSSLYKFQKTVQRNKLLFLGIGVITAILVSSLIVLSTLLEKERHAHQQSQQVTQILEDMLKGAAPSVAQGEDTKMLREILDRTAERIGTELHNQPAVEGQLCSVMAKVYLNLSCYESAAKMDRIALADEQKLYGPQSVEVAASRYNLGMALLRDGHLAEAEKEHLEALSIRQHLLGTTNADVAASLDGLGSTYRDEWRLTEADPLIRRALAIRRQLFPGNTEAVADSLQSLCRLFVNERRWPEAETNALEFLEMSRHLAGRSDMVAEALDDVALAAGFNGQLDVQAKANKEAFGIKEKILPEDHPYLVKSIANLGEILRLQGKTVEARAVLLGVISIQSKLLGKDHPDTLASLGSLGQVLEGEGQWAEAEAVHRNALALWRQRAGDQDPGTLWEVGELVRDLAAQKKFAEMEQLLNETLTPAFVAQPSSADLLATRCDLMARHGRWQQAAADAALVPKYLPNDHYRYHTLAGLLGITHHRPEYEKLCQRILPMFADTSNPYIAERVADDCLLLPDSGVDLQMVDRLATRAATNGNDASAIGYFQGCKALSEYRQGQFSEAVVWAEKSLKTDQAFAQAKGYAVLALAQWQLGQKEKARAMLASGDSLAPRISSAQDAVDLGDSWAAWLFARILLDEAGQLIQPETIIEAKGKQ
jgi:serine/threonine protein kinase/tetratricopeptide (TPR) repeat protein